MISRTALRKLKRGHDCTCASAHESLTKGRSDVDNCRHHFKLQTCFQITREKLLHPTKSTDKSRQAPSRPRTTCQRVSRVGPKPSKNSALPDIFSRINIECLDKSSRPLIMAAKAHALDMGVHCQSLMRKHGKSFYDCKSCLMQVMFLRLQVMSYASHVFTTASHVVCKSCFYDYLVGFLVAD